MSQASAVQLRASAPPRKSRALLYVIVGIVVVAALAAFVTVRKKGQQAVTVVSTENAVVKTITQLVSATGKVQPEVEVKIFCEVSGEILALPFREGAAVKKGQ